MNRSLAVFFVALVLGLGLAGHLAPPAGTAHAQSPPAQTPLAQAWNAASGGGLVFPAGFRPIQDGDAIRISVCLATAGPLTIRETSGATTLVATLNGGVDLPANQAFTFVWGTRKYSSGTVAISYNLGCPNGGTVLMARVEEVSGGAL